MATGRGLPTYRRPFIGEIEPGTTKLTKAYFEVNMAMVSEIRPILRYLTRISR